MNASASARGSFEDDLDAVTGNAHAAQAAIRPGDQPNDPAATPVGHRMVSPSAVERSDRRGQQAEELLPADAHLQVAVEVHSAAGDGGPDGEHLAFRQRSRRAVRPGHPVAINQHDGAQGLRNALAPDHVQDRRARVDVEIDAVAGASLGREVRGEGGEQLERDLMPRRPPRDTPA